MSYKVLYNNDYGGFSIPTNVVKEVFIRYPPHNSLGNILFPAIDMKSNLNNIKICNYEQFIGDYYFVITKKTVRSVPEKSNYIFNKSNNKFYYLTDYPSKWRDIPEVISICEEMGVIGKDSDLAIKEVPKGYTYRIREYDGLESVELIFPTKLVISELLSYAEDKDKSKLSEMTLRLVNKELNVNEIKC